MMNGDEVVSPATADETPLPIPVGEIVLSCAQPTPPTPAAILQAIAAAGEKPWFPSRYATDHGINRDSLDDPLNLLRLAGLVQIATWERGQGQGYILTSAGEAAMASGAGIPDAAGKLTDPASGPSFPTVTETPDKPADADTGEFPVPHLGLDPRSPLVVPLLLVANVLWFFVGMVIASRAGLSLGKFLLHGNTDILHRIGSVSGADLLRGDWWRLLTACFVHANGLHLLMNLAAGLLMVGPLAELLWGRGRLLIIYLLSGLGGSCLAMALRPEAPLVGASGAICGVLTAVLAWFIMFRDRLPPEIASDALRRLLLAVILTAATSALPQISWEGHLGGAVVGFTTAGLLNAIRYGNRRDRRVTLGILLFIPVFCLGGLAAMMTMGEPWAAIRHRVAVAHAAREAAAAYNRDVAPLIDRLKPEAVQPIEQRARSLLSRSGERRNAAAVTETRTRLAELKDMANAALGHLEGPAVGDAVVDGHRTRAREFATLRARSFEMLLVMLDSPAIPDVAAWQKWGNARRAADALWPSLSRP